MDTLKLIRDQHSKRISAGMSVEIRMPQDDHWRLFSFNSQDQAKRFKEKTEAEGGETRTPTLAAAAKIA